VPRAAQGAGANLLAGTALLLLTACVECTWPGEGSVAYVSRGAGQYDIRVVDGDGVCDRAVSTSKGDELSPSVSLAASLFVYAAYRGAPARIAVRDLYTGTERVLDTGDLVVASPEVSPDGRLVVFEGSRPPARPDIYVAPVSGGAPSPLAEDAALDVGPSWSSDGASVFFGSTRSGSYQIWRVGLDGSGLAQVTTDATSALSCGSGACAVLGKARPSPDGRLLALVRATPDQVYRVVIRDLESGQERVLADAGETEPSWAPSGNEIAVASGIYGYPQVVVRDVATGALLRRLTFTSAIEGAPYFAR
jgi:TolB protein